MKRIACFFALGILVFLGACGHQEQPSVNLFFTADVEGVFWARPEPHYGNEVTGGLSVLKAFLDKQTTPFLLLEGGNWFAQTPEGTLTQGAYFNSAAASLPYAGRLFTEQDLAYGWDSLSKIIKSSSVPFILSNVTLKNGKVPAGAKSYLLKEVGGYKIGILGIVSSLAATNKQRADAITIQPEIETARQMVQQLREAGAQVVVALSALNVSGNEPTLTETELAEEVEGIDVIILSNLDRETAEVTRVGKTLLVYPGARLDGVGQVELFFNKSGDLTDARFKDVALYRRDYGEDLDVLAQIENVRRAAQAPMSRPIGRSEKELTGRLNQESDLGNWAADCVRKWAKADVAIVNSAALRESLPQGQVTQYDLYKVYPYADHVTVLTMRGDALLQALNAGLLVPDNFAQISGLRVRYKRSAPAGEQVVSVLVNQRPLQFRGTYRVAVTDHMLAGGAGHDAFIDSLEFKNTQVEMRTVLRLCLTGTNISPTPEAGRWSVQP